MNTASSLFVLILLGSLVADAVAQVHYQEPIPPYVPTSTYIEPSPYPSPVVVIPSQIERVISRRTLQTIYRWEQQELSELLRVSIHEARDLEVLSVTVRAQAFRAQTHLEVLSQGRPIAPQQFISRNLKDVQFHLPPQTRLDELELSATDDLLLDSLTVEVRERRGGHYEQQPLPNQLINLRITKSIHGQGEVNLKQLVKQQLGLNIEGAQIQRVVVQGHLLRGASASVQVQMNNRILGPIKYISHSSRQTPIPLNTIDSVQGALKLKIRGDVQISNISIRLGNVRQIRY